MARRTSRVTARAVVPRGAVMILALFLLSACCTSCLAAAIHSSVLVGWQATEPENVAAEVDVSAAESTRRAESEMGPGLQRPSTDTAATDVADADHAADAVASEALDVDPRGQASSESGSGTLLPETQSAETQSAETQPRESPEDGEAVAGEGARAVEASAASGGRKLPVQPSSVWLNWRTNTLLGVVLVVLGIASIVGQYLRRRPSESINPALVRRFRQRINAWWLMCSILVFGLLLQPIGTVVLFGLVSFWALREFITMAPTRRGDHRALFWAIVVFTPLQYVLIGLERADIVWRSGNPVDFYGIYSIMIPVYASLFVPARIALAGDHKRFLERSAQITVGLLICVYSLSYAPAVINLNLARSDGTPWAGDPAGVLFFFVLMTQLTDILQWSWGQVVGRRIIAEEVSRSRTWEGFAGGTLSAGLIGAALCWVTPFNFVEAACMSMVIGVMGMFGGMTMSAIKRNRGVNDYGSLVLGHAGVLDRIDTICFAAPIFYHLTRFFFTVTS